MKKLTAVTSDDSSTMRIFAFITLILLPVSVVSVRLYVSGSSVLGGDTN